MGAFSTQMTDVLSTISDSLMIPVIILILVLIVITIIMVGMIVVEYFTEHRHLHVCMPVFMEELRNPQTDLAACINNSGLLKRQKETLLELTKHESFSDKTLDALAVRLFEEEKAYWMGRIHFSNLLARLGPMLGLLGTLIPLGPGITSLGMTGSTTLLAASINTAFSTTIAGIACAAVAMIISYLRKKWYANYISILEALMECVLEVVKDA